MKGGIKMKRTTMRKVQSKTERLLRLAMVTIMLLVMLPTGFVYAAGGDGDNAGQSDGASREVHKVKVGNKKYCFFANDVVMTPGDIAKLSDNLALANEIAERAGLVIKEANCRKAKSKSFTAKAWLKSGRAFLLDDEDIERLREAAPSDGSPVKLYMDLNVAEKVPGKVPKQQDDPAAGTGTDPSAGTGTDPATDPVSGDDTDWEYDPDVQTYSTRKTLQQHLLYVVVATDSDAKTSEDICEYPKPKKYKEKNPPSGGEKEEMLPEYRTIQMADRSGVVGKLKPTLEDGEPVTLEWIEPSRRKDKEDGSMRWPLWIAGGLCLSLLVAILIYRKKKSESDE